MRGLRLLRAITGATGLRRTYALFGGSAALAVCYPSGTIDAIGPFPVQPELRVLVAVPLILAAVTSVAHSPSGTPVVRQSARVTTIRAVLLAIPVLVSVAILSLGAGVAEDAAVLGALLRNYLWLTGMALTVSALAGTVYAWLPLAFVFGVTLILPASESRWSPYGMLFSDVGTLGQLLAAAAVFALGAGVFVWNPRHFGYLPAVRSAMPSPRRALPPGPSPYEQPKPRRRR